MRGTRVEIRMDLDGDGRPLFAVDACDRVGASIRLWQGPSYETAILEAEAARVDFGPIRDRVLDGARVLPG